MKITCSLRIWDFWLEEGIQILTSENKYKIGQKCLKQQFHNSGNLPKVNKQMERNLVIKSC